MASRLGLRVTDHSAARFNLIPPVCLQGSDLARPAHQPGGLHNKTPPPASSALPEALAAGG
ncbi:MAG: hypothetical protein CTY31_03565 [Hyphomicrobium sp.]|nr:MAG: hypothetical protein CTY31_03565 [Hyphomicrobium sp.]